MKKYILILFSLLMIASCNTSHKEKTALVTNSISTSTNNKQFNYKIETIVTGIDNPWGMTWLPDGSMLITEKSGELLHFKNNIKTYIKNVPTVYNRGQGGLLDIELHPDYENNGWIYFTYAFQNPEKGMGNGGNTKLSRAKLIDGALTAIEDLYQATPNTTRGQHFGSRIAFDSDGYLYFSIGERGERDINPQDLSRDGGKIYRLHDDGRIPDDNPFIDTINAKKAIYTYGNRNPQGMAKHPTTGDIWIHEHGPRGGDEINIVKKGANYGWPVISHGINYSGTKFTELTKKKGMEQPIHYWTPSIAPCGMTFVTSDRYPDWKGHLLVGSLKFNYVELLTLNGNTIIEQIKIAENVGRVRNVKQGPDGYIYIGIEGKGIVRIVPNS